MTCVNYSHCCVCFNVFMLSAKHVLASHASTSGPGADNTPPRIVSVVGMGHLKGIQRILSMATGVSHNRMIQINTHAIMDPKGSGSLVNVCDWLGPGRFHMLAPEALEYL